MADTAPTASQSPARKAHLPDISPVFAATAATAATSPTSGAQNPDMTSTLRHRHKVDLRPAFTPGNTGAIYARDCRFRGPVHGLSKQTSDVLQTPRRS
jgi:hypothetical protein